MKGIALISIEDQPDESLLKKIEQFKKLDQDDTANRWQARLSIRQQYGAEWKQFVQEFRERERQIYNQWVETMYQNGIEH